MFFFDFYDYYIPQQILGFLIVLGIPLMILSEMYFTKVRRIKHVKIIFGATSIIFGSAILIIAIWGDIGWRENREYTVTGFDYGHLFALCIVLCIVFVIRGMILINKGKNIE
ncbi:MAG: hypothetical protein ACXACX_10205 [Candidatus Hodarchaeales archaeon]|jgi:predicted permease